MREFEVEIDGAVFTVKQIEPEYDGEYGEEEAALVARACLLYEDEEKMKAYAPEKELETKTVYEKTIEQAKEVIRENITEKAVEGHLENLKNTYMEENDTSANYRRQIEQLSRYLSRDSRRYDGNFEIY